MFSLSKNYITDLINKKFATADILKDNTPHEIVMTGIVSSKGIVISNFSGKVGYSVGFASDQIYQFVDLAKVFDQVKGIEGWVQNDIVKTKNNKPSIYLKLKFDKEGNFAHSNNIGMVDANSACFQYVTNGCRLDTRVTVHAYFDPSKKTFGLYLTVKDLDFNMDDINEVKKYYE